MPRQRGARPRSPTTLRFLSCQRPSTPACLGLARLRPPRRPPARPPLRRRFPWAPAPEKAAGPDPEPPRGSSWSSLTPGRVVPPEPGEGCSLLPSCAPTRAGDSSWDPEEGPTPPFPAPGRSRPPSQVSPAPPPRPALLPSTTAIAPGCGGHRAGPAAGPPPAPLPDLPHSGTPGPAACSPPRPPTRRSW